MFIRIIQIKGGLFDILGLEQDEKDSPHMESRVLQMDQVQQKLRTTSDATFESLTKLLLTSGEYLDICIETFNCLMKEKEVTSLHTFSFPMFYYKSLELVAILNFHL